MDLQQPPPEDVLAHPVRGRLFALLAELRRPATTAELAAEVGRHANSTRLQLQRLASAGLVECRLAGQARGRPRHEWAVAAGARPLGMRPEAHGQLSRWLARAVGHGEAGLEGVEEAGRAIGRELAPPAHQPPAEAVRDALSALGFSPRVERPDANVRRYVLDNCPYREAVRENQPAVCTLHRGITAGLLDRLDPEARLTGFVARDPYAAGCLIEVTEPG